MCGGVKHYLQYNAKIARQLETAMEIERKPQKRQTKNWYKCFSFEWLKLAENMSKNSMVKKEFEQNL